MPKTGDMNNVRAQKNNFVYIAERFDDMKLVNKNEYVFEGICAVFDVMNENKRVYTKDDYLPHLKYLNEKIQKNRLTGELDHPASFEPSLRNTSHIIEKLWFEEDNNCVKIRVRLLDTPSGQIARTLVDSGVPLAISSRAAGQVMTEGKVKLHRIFAYDLVGEPGFADAILGPVSESLKVNYDRLFEGLNDIKERSIIDEMDDITNKYNYGESTKIYKINESQMDSFNKAINKDQENNGGVMQEHVTKEEFDGYSKMTKERFDKMTEAMANIQEAMKGINDIKAKLINENEDEGAETPPVEGAEGAEGGGEAQTTELENITSDDDQDAQMEKLISYVNFLAKQVEAIMGFSNYVTEMLNRSISYSENIGKTVTALANFSNYMAEQVNAGFNFSNVLADLLNKGLNHNDYLAERIDQVILHGNYLAEKINQNIDFSDHLGNISEKHIRFSNYITSMINTNKLAKGIVNTDAPRDLNQHVTNITEGKQEGAEATGDNTGEKDIYEQVNDTLQEIQSHTKDAVLENRYPFLKLLSEENKKRFYTLTKDQKSEIVNTLAGSVYFNESEVVDIMEATLSAMKGSLPYYIQYMPQEYKELYEQMNESEKTRIDHKAKMYKLVNPYHVKTFWDAMDLKGVKERLAAEQSAINKANEAVLNESQSKEGFVPAKQVLDAHRGYSDDYIQTLLDR